MIDGKTCTIRLADHDTMCLTRPKARLIFEKEKARLSKTGVVIDLTGLSIVTATFLDELIRLLNERGVLSSTIFRYDNPKTLERLQYLVKERRVKELKVQRNECAEEVLRWAHGEED